ncbi:DNA repair protein RadA [Anaerotignum faecicola]|nr:DNA repair protein RadA [Anaerotignum faecicola]
MKDKKIYVCSNCGNKSARWMGVCHKCGEYNTFEEKIETSGKTGIKTSAIQTGSRTGASFTRLKNVETNSSQRIVTSINEFNRVVGGGIVRDSVTIISSPPGVGKSTLSLAVCNDIADKGFKVLYASGEESESQIKGRADRILDNINENIYIISDTCLDNVLTAAEEIKTDLIVVDSIQTFALNAFLPSRAGNPTQTMECAGELVRLAKGGGKSTAVIIIGQMNKNDELAGLRALEHLADTVLILDGDNDEELRSIVATKNRFGSTGEMGFFSMTEKGLISIDNPSEFFVTKREEGQEVSGSAITVVREGSRPVIAEIESLVSRSYTPYPSRIGEALRREQLNTLISILEQRCKINLFDKNVVIKTAGGLKLKEPASNLAVIMCIASSVFNKPINGSSAFIADVGLTGELKKVPGQDQRIKELARMGFKKVYTAAGSSKPKTDCKIEIKQSRYVMDVISEVFGN